MSPVRHLKLLVQAVLVWLAFFLIGLPDYYQQYPDAWLGVGSVLLSVGFSLTAVLVLSRGRPELRRQRAFWIAFYFTVPFAILDSLYCGIYQGHGWEYLGRYWYLSVFYLTPWLTFPPTAWIMGRARD